jgi:hypothetical protein
LSSRSWVFFNLSPLWIEESGLPELLCSKSGPEAWGVFRRLTEADCAANLLPDWFSVSRENLARWSGLPEETLCQVLKALSEAGLIHVQEFGTAFRIRIETPLGFPVSPETLKTRLRKRGIRSDRVQLRYTESRKPEERFDQVLELYQTVFGARVNPQIVEDLRELAVTFEWSAIEEAFEEARHRKNYTLHGVMHHLYREAFDESLAENIRDADPDTLPGGYEFT